LRSEEPAPGFVEGVRKLADSSGSVLIMDEISAGFRLITGGAHLVKHSTTPDMAVFSKALGNGYPIAAIIGTEAVMQAAQGTFISSTCWTERVGPVAALAMLKKHREQDVARHLVALGEAVQYGWAKASQESGLDLHIGGMAPMSHFSFSGPLAQSQKAYFIQFMLERGILASNLFYAMYAHSFADVERYLAACGEAFDAIVSAGDKVDGLLKGKPSATGFSRIA
jgi:glutamate-1-semialdehyde 2,1-aminomutase